MSRCRTGRLARAAAGLLLAVSLAAFGQEVAVPPLSTRVTDLTGTLSDPQRQLLESSLRDFEQRKGSQIAVLMLPSTQPETIEQYSIRVAEAWKIGRRKVDDGLILIIAKNDRRVRIEVGRGLEGPIPDVIASRVIREVIAPHFLAGDFHGGVAAGTQAMMKLIEGEALPEPARQADSGSRDWQSSLVTLVFIALAVGAVLRAMLGRVAGSVLTGAVAGGAAFFIASSLFGAILFGIVAFLFTLLGGGTFGRGFGGWSGGSWSSGGGGFSGGGGDFGGGGASGRW